MCVWFTVWRCAAQWVLCMYMWLFVKTELWWPWQCFSPELSETRLTRWPCFGVGDTWPPSLAMSKSTCAVFISVSLTFRPNFSHCLFQPRVLIVFYLFCFFCLCFFSCCLVLPLSFFPCLGLTQSSAIPLSHLSVTDRPVFQMAARLPSSLSVHIKLCLINA